MSESNMTATEMWHHLKKAMGMINQMYAGAKDGYVISFSTNPDHLGHAVASARLTAWSSARFLLIEQLPFLRDVPEPEGMYPKEYEALRGTKTK